METITHHTQPRRLPVNGQPRPLAGRIVPGKKFSTRNNSTDFNQ
jgi:hypothetical protein